MSCPLITAVCDGACNYQQKSVGIKVHKLSMLVFIIVFYYCMLCYVGTWK